MGLSISAFEFLFCCVDLSKKHPFPESILWSLPIEVSSVVTGRSKLVFLPQNTSPSYPDLCPPSNLHKWLRKVRHPNHHWRRFGLLPDTYLKIWNRGVQRNETNVSVLMSLLDLLRYTPSQTQMTPMVSVITVCKGTYASVRPYRHTYGNYGIWLQTWTRVIVNRCIGKIIARDPSLVASWLYRTAVTRTLVTCRRYTVL